MLRVQTSIAQGRVSVPTASPRSRMRAAAQAPKRASAHAPSRRRRTACAAQSPTSTVDNADQPPLSAKAALSASKDVVDAGKEALESSKDDVLETAAAAGDALSSVASSAATTAAERLRKLSASASEDRPYAAPNALSLARRRALQKWLPYRWAETARRVLENIPAQQFSYLQSTGAILFTAVTAFGVAYASWPAVHSVVLWAFAAGGPEARNMQEMTFETQYLAAVSLLTAILLGNSFGLCFGRQAQLVQEMGEEALALELLLQELFIEIPEPHLRWRVIKHIRSYVDNEMQVRDVDSPFSAKGSIVGLFDALLTLKSQENRQIGKLVDCVEMLARANSRRGGIAASQLPSLHWVMLSALISLVLVAFVLFDSDFNTAVEENRRTFSVIAATFATILAVLRDIADPDDGIYSCRDPMETRLSYVRWQMDNIMADPTIKVSMLDSDGEDVDTSESEGESESTASSSGNGAPADKPESSAKAAKDA